MNLPGKNPNLRPKIREFRDFTDEIMGFNGEITGFPVKIPVTGAKITDQTSHPGLRDRRPGERRSGRRRPRSLDP